MILWGINLVQSSPGQFFCPMSCWLGLFDCIQWVAHLVWKIQDGFCHIYGTLVGMAGRPLHWLSLEVCSNFLHDGSGLRKTELEGAGRLKPGFRTSIASLLLSFVGQRSYRLDQIQEVEKLDHISWWKTCQRVCVVVFSHQESFNFMAAVTIHSDFGAWENKVCHCFHCFASICHKVMGLDAMILLSFKPGISLMKQLTDSKLGKEYDKAVYCDPVCWT